MIVADLQDGNVLAFGKVVGRLDSEPVKQFLRACSRYQMSEALRSAVSRIVIDKGRCPICSASDKFVEKIVVDGVRIGYCLDCREDVAISNTNEWTSVWHSYKNSGHKQVIDLLK